MELPGDWQWSLWGLPVEADRTGNGVAPLLPGDGHTQASRLRWPHTHPPPGFAAAPTYFSGGLTAHSRPGTQSHIGTPASLSAQSPFLFGVTTPEP